jgi:hypothetical protein
MFYYFFSFLKASRIIQVQNRDWALTPKNYPLVARILFGCQRAIILEK